MQVPGGNKPETALGRRRFLRRLIGFIASFLFLDTWMMTAVARVRRLLAPDADLANMLYENPADLDIRNLPLTPIKKFGVSGIDEPNIDMDTWHLELEGLVQQPGKFSYAELMSRPRFVSKALLICPGTFAYVALWQGFSLWDILVQRGISPKATHIDIKGPPATYRKTARFAVDEIQKNKVFLAYAVNDQTLPKEHGFPLRVVAQDHVGARWVKYVYGIEAIHSKETPRKKTPAQTEGSSFFP